MCGADSQCCITRVIDGAGCHLELVQLQAVMQRIQQALHGVPVAQRTYIGNALFNLAVKRILSDAGSQRATGILMRLSDVLNTSAPVPDAAQVVSPARLQA